MDAIVVVPCCYKPAGKLCPVTIARLERAVSAAKSLESRNLCFVLVGDVPKTSKSLAEQMRDWLREKSSWSIYIAKQSGDTIADCKAALETLRGLDVDHVFIVSSRWHWQYARFIWQYYTEHSLNYTLVPPNNDDPGQATQNLYHRLHYLAAFTYSSFGRLVGMPRLMEKLSERNSANRRQSFTFDGCR